ncbi:hypothetical protein [Paracidovorax cattleyae]|nr:hypothetical protein [Paracidovorax cattleyae]MBF9264559.1 hypothetical protein [Paracidovorax cattleyae]
MAADSVMDPVVRPAPAPVIPALVARHAGDAAFYWQQHDASPGAPLVGLPQILEYGRLLDAHLDGLRVAGDAGWAAALNEVKRWNGAPEVFVTTLLALESQPPGDRLAGMWAIASTRPERTLRGLVSALAWHEDPAPALVWLRHWLGHGDGVPVPLQVACWRVLALRGRGVGDAEGRHFAGLLTTALSAPDAHLRAAACRFAAVWDAGRLPAMLQDSEVAVRAEAAVGLLGASATATAEGALPHPDGRMRGVEVLWLACHTLAQSLPTLSGWYRHRAEHRLTRWVKELAMSAPLGHPGVARLLELLPSRLGLWFVLHHVDACYLPWVEPRMADPAMARFAGWVWSMLSGVDLQGQGWVHPPKKDDGSAPAVDARDAGLPEPDGARVAAAGIRLPAHVPHLMGKPLEGEHVKDVLRSGPQALRWIAARHMGHAVNGVQPFSPRDPAPRQWQWMASAFG